MSRRTDVLGPARGKGWVGAVISPFAGLCCGGALFFGLFTAPTAGAQESFLERLRYTCSNDLGRRDITLFANGTVRLREGPWEEQHMLLTELSPEELEGQLRILAEIRQDSLEPRLAFPGSAIGGPWVDRCSLSLELPDMVRVTMEFSQYEVPPLWVSRAIQLAEGLALRVRPLAPLGRLEQDYTPHPGDRLKNAAGERFVVVGLTSDGQGIELEALDAPLRSFHRLEDLHQEFVLADPQEER